MAKQSKLERIQTESISGNGWKGLRRGIYALAAAVSIYSCSSPLLSNLSFTNSPNTYAIAGHEWSDRIEVNHSGMKYGASSKPELNLQISEDGVVSARIPPSISEFEVTETAKSGIWDNSIERTFKVDVYDLSRLSQKP